MANGWLIEQEIDLAQPVSRQYTYPHGLAMSGDDRAQRLIYTIYDGQNAADLSGTVKAYYRRPDNTVIESTSGGDYVTVVNNTVEIEMPPEAYEQTGNVECLVKLYATDGKIITLARCDINVTHGVEQDETIIPAGEASRASLEDRVAAIEAATGVVPIDQLPSLPRTIDYRDYVIVDDGNGPYKLNWLTLKDAVYQYLYANNLTTTSDRKLLDARQGKELDEKKQDVLTFDATPTTGSTNPVTSGGTKAAIETALQRTNITDQITVNNSHVRSGTANAFLIGGLGVLSFSLDINSTLANNTILLTFNSALNIQGLYVMGALFNSTSALATTASVWFERVNEATVVKYYQTSAPANGQYFAQLVFMLQP